MGASPWNADLLKTGRQGERAPAPGVNDQVPGLFWLDRQHHQVPHSPASRARVAVSHMAAKEERVA